MQPKKRHNFSGGGCEEYELLISKACDDECTPDELSRLRKHLSSCVSCRRLMEEYKELNVLMLAHLTSMSCPQPPSIAGNTTDISAARKFFTNPRMRDSVKQFARIAACIMFFLLGHYIGFYQSGGKTAQVSPFVAVATPSMWAEARPVNSASSAGVGAEQPFTEGIDRYRLAIGDELRKSDVNWMRVRDLVEAMGELRTDIELLTIHMAYLDIRTGSSPYEVADHWENLGRSAKTAKTVKAVH